MRHNRFARLAGAALALLLAPAAWADLGGQAGPYTVRIRMQPATPVVGDNQARIQVTSPDGRPAKGARVSVTADMLDMAMLPSTTQATDDGTGTYTAPMSLSMGGNWKLKVAVDGPAGKGETQSKVTTGVSTAGSRPGGTPPWRWIGLGALAAVVIGLLRVRGPAARRHGDTPTREAGEPGTGAVSGQTPAPVRPFTHWVRSHFWGLVVLGLAVVASSALIHKYKKPGQTTVLAAQAMDMSGMKAPVGAVPVKTETVQPGPFESAVTYTGSVVSETDEDVYPRVVGTITWMPLYPGDRVAAGQVVARLDNVELSSKADEARADRLAKSFDSAMAAAGVSQAESQRNEAEARALKARSGVRDAQSGVAAAQGAVQQARSGLDAMRSDLRDAQSQQVSAQEDRQQALEAQQSAQASLGGAEAGVTTAQANLDYWRTEIKRQAYLLKGLFISQQDYDREYTQYVAAQAALRQAQERVRSMQSGVRASAAKVKQSEASIAGAQARADKAQASIAGAQAQIDQAQAALQSASARVSSAQAEVSEADAAVRTAGQAVRVAQEGAGRGAAAEQGAGAAERTADIVRGYTEIRASGSGRVTQRYVAPGVLVSPGTPILRIAHIDRVRLQANVATADLADIKVGALVQVTSQKDPNRVISTRITSVFPAADASSRTSVVEALTPNPGANTLVRPYFLPGEFVTMKITTGDDRQALSVASSALTDFDGQPAVWKVVNGKAQRAPVTTGKTDGQRTQILSGLNAGDVVITEGGDYLKPDDAVTPTPWGADGPPDSALQHQFAAPTTSTPGTSGSAAPAAPSSGPADGGKDSLGSMPGMGR